MSSKKEVFLSSANTSAMARRIYAAHQNEGGSRFLNYFQDQVAGLMQQWPRVNMIDSYESLTEDPELEMEQINQDFYRATVNQFLPAAGYSRVKKLETVADYLNYDIQREPAAVTNNAVYRDGNGVPRDRKWVASRHYERADDMGTSRSLKNRAMPGMDELWENVNRPATAVDQDDVRYYGQVTDDDSSVLINTSW